MLKEVPWMKMNMISNPTIAAADPQAIRHQLSACTGLSGRVAAAESFGAGFMVLPRPWSAQTQGASGPATVFAAQISTAPASGPCARKQYQQMASIVATSGGALGPHPPRDPV
ncbi:MAG: hypothetical protein ABJB47_06265 [Actinomycetota bacterium]